MTKNSSWRTSHQWRDRKNATNKVMDGGLVVAGAGERDCGAAQKARRRAPSNVDVWAHRRHQLARRQSSSCASWRHRPLLSWRCAKRRGGTATISGGAQLLKRTDADVCTR
jgi:hypothetical protein